MGMRTGGSSIDTLSAEPEPQSALLFSEFCVDRQRAYVAVTTVLMPPRTEKSPTTVMRRGWSARDEIVEDLVGDVLVEDAAVAELDHVVLERFQLDAPRVGDVA